MLNEQVLHLDLQLFAEGGAEGVSGTSAQSDSSVNSEEVIYGTQPDNTLDVPVAEEQDKDTNPDEILDTEFSELIKKGGKYAKQYQKKFMEGLNNRTKGVEAKLRSAEENHNKYTSEVNPVLEKMYNKYGVKIGDINALNEAIDSDNAFYDDAALKAGMTPEEYKLKMENDRLTRTMNEQHRRQVAQEQVNTWLQEAEELKQIYPDFDLDTEIEDGVFATLLHRGFAMKKAYEAAHHDDLMSTAMQHTAQTVEDKVVNNIRANKSRPVENGVSSQSASKVKNSVSTLSYEDMDRIDAMARQGKKITFRR